MTFATDPSGAVERHRPSPMMGAPRTESSSGSEISPGFVYIEEFLHDSPRRERLATLSEPLSPTTIGVPSSSSSMGKSSLTSSTTGHQPPLCDETPTSSSCMATINRATSSASTTCTSTAHETGMKISGSSSHAKGGGYASPPDGSPRTRTVVHQEPEDRSATKARLSRHEQLAIEGTLAVNAVLAITKLVTFLMSWSMSVLASLVDSCVDLAAQSVLW